MRSDLREYLLQKVGIYSDEQYISFLEENVTALEIKVKNLTAHNTGSPKCEQCKYHHTVETSQHCEGCSRFHIDRFTLRAGA